MVTSAAHRVVPERTEILIDDSYWPALIVTPPVSVTDEQMQDFMGKFRQLERDKGEDYALILDLRDTKKLTSEQREMLTEQMGKDKDNQYCQCLAMIFESRMLRGILTMMFWVRKPPYPTKVFPTPEGALEWALGMVDHGQPESEVATLAKFFLQGDGFLKRVRARDELAAVEALDIPCMLAQEQVGERIMHMVRVGPFDTKEEANDALDKLTEAGISVRLLR